MDHVLKHQWHDDGTTRTAVVIPAYNEERFIEGVIQSIPDWVTWIIAVDDGSSDETNTILTGIRNTKLQILRHKKNLGVGAAIVSGYKRAIALEADIAVVVGGDAQMDPRDMAALIKPVFENHADYVKGNRFTFPGGAKRIPFPRRMGIRVFTRLTAWATRSNGFGDAQCGYTAASCRMLRNLNLDTIYTRYGFPNHMIATVVSSGFRMIERPVRPIYGEEISGIRPMRDLPRLIQLLIKMRRAKHRRPRDQAGTYCREKNA